MYKTTRCMEIPEWTGTDRNGHRSGPEWTVEWTGMDSGMDRNGPFRYFHTPTSALLNSVCSFTDSFVHHFIFLMRFWSFPYFHMKLLLLIKTLKGRFRSVPVFPYSNTVYFQFCSYSFNDLFVRHFIVLVRFWSFPNFHMELLLLIKTFKGRSGPFRYFHTPTSDVFNSIDVHSHVRYFIFLIRFFGLSPFFHIGFCSYERCQRSIRVRSSISLVHTGSFQFGSCSF